MADWEFEVVPAKFVQQNPTQRDQFNNDEVGLTEALVREVIQNSTDAAATDEPVKVCFSVRNLNAENVAKLKTRFEKLRPHLQECNVDTSAIDAQSARVLVVEDFGTRGLTGDPGSTDNQNFHNFWRVHGGSGKGGTSGGRWGLGKLVFSSSSEIHAFFGLTFREGDSGPLLMGQAVLKSHVINGKRHPPHGFWFGSRGNEEIQLPVDDNEVVADFRALTGLARQHQPGLSVIVPYLRSGIDETSIIEAVLGNYYFPILAGRLAVEVGNVTINRDSFHEIAAAHKIAKTGTPIALGFVEAVSDRLNATPEFTATGALGVRGVTDKLFTADDLENMKARYRDGKLVHVRIPVKLRRKNGDELGSFISLYMQSLPENEKPFALYARGSITVPGENRYFGGVQAYGAMVATDPGVTEFLGDAENPAHTNWIASAEKLSERWQSTNVVKQIRYALRDLHLLIGEQVAHEDRDALLDLFSLIDPASSTKGAKKKNKKPKIDVPPRDKAISIRPRKGGFEIVAGPGAAKWSFPKKVRIRVAYDTMIGNPFKAHSKYDFDLTKGEIALEATDATVAIHNEYILVATVDGPDFSVTGSGFDQKRDIVVDARAA